MEAMSNKQIRYKVMIERIFKNDFGLDDKIKPEVI